MGKRSRKARESDIGFEDREDMLKEKLAVGNEEYFVDDDDDDEEDMEEEGEEENSEDEDEGDGSDGKEEDDGEKNDVQRDAEMEELEKEYMYLRNQEQDILKNLKQHKEEDFLKGQAVKNQKALWDKNLEIRFLLQKAFSSSNRLPKAAVKSAFCELDVGVDAAYSNLIASSKKTLDSLIELQEALLENNKSIAQGTDGSSMRSESYKIMDVEDDEDWSRLAQMHLRIAPFRNKSIDKWQRKTLVTTGAAAVKGRLQAFNQNISEQVATYMRDPSRMIKQMQQRRATLNPFGSVSEEGNGRGEDVQADGDPELLDDSEFYQQLLKEFLETIDPNSSDTAFYTLKRLQTKKRKIVDRRASKSRKIRYNVHEKIVNFMAPQPMDLPPMAPKLFENLFGLKTHKPTSVV